jgi:hypothetical protein
MGKWAETASVSNLKPAEEEAEMHKTYIGRKVNW